MHDEYSYVIGNFQPLTKSSINTVREILFDHRKKMNVYVRKNQRGPDAPWTFEQVKNMWETIFDVEANMGNLFVYKANGEIPKGNRIEIIDAESEERKARNTLTGISHISYDPLWEHEAVPISVARIVASFNDESWREYIGSCSRVLP